jgi:hypothetical protein
MSFDWIENCLVMEFTGSVNIEGAVRFKEQIEQAQALEFCRTLTKN